MTSDYVKNKELPQIRKSHSSRWFLGSEQH